MVEIHNRQDSGDGSIRQEMFDNRLLKQEFRFKDSLEGEVRLKSTISGWCPPEEELEFTIDGNGKIYFNSEDIPRKPVECLQ